jgi:cytosine/adenosine deaminase-related metal-dependent hydrolase
MLLKGDVVTPNGVIASGWLHIEQGKIVEISTARPNVRAAVVLETEDFIFPGFVDLHNHPMYNMLERWQPGRTYDNRYKWRSGDAGYDAAIRIPQAAIVADHFCDIDEYVEVKALAGGTTTIVGTSKPSKLSNMPECIRGLARNLDWYTGFYGDAIGTEPVRNAIGITPLDMKAEQLAQYRNDLASGKARLLLIHIAEGKRSDAESQGEFGQLVDSGLLSDRTAIVHGVALGSRELSRMAKAGTALVWSPRSNFELYGETADIREATRLGVSVALAPDWSPSGSTNMLAELRYAWALSKDRLNGAIPPRQLFDMATSIPARIAGIDDKVGAIAVGRYADLFLLRRNSAADAYTNLVAAPPPDVSLSMVGGVPVYGQAERLSQLGVTEREAVSVCGTRRELNKATLTSRSLTDVMTRLRQALRVYKVPLGPLAEC